MSSNKTQAVLDTANRLHETMQNAQKKMEDQHYVGQSHDISITLNGRYELINIQLSPKFMSQSVEQATQNLKSSFDMALDEIRTTAHDHLTKISQEFSNQLSDNPVHNS